MNRQDKEILEQEKPIEEQSYWALSKNGKETWLKHHNLNKKMDVIFPIIEFGISIIIFIILCLGLAFAKSTGLFIVIVTFICYLPLFIWIIFRMVKTKRGLFICRYWQVEKAYKEQQKQNNNKKRTSDQISEEAIRPKNTDNMDSEMI